jgi:hypothetical protein
MEYANITTGLFVVAVCGMIGFCLYGIYGGFRSDMCNAKVGQVFNFEYLQPLNGEPERYLAKVIESPVTLDDATIESMNRRSTYRRTDPMFKRTNHLVTCKTIAGNIRQFYCERVVNCRRPLLAGWLV